MKYVFGLTALLFSFHALATGVSGRLSYQGRIIKPNGTPLEASSVVFTLQVRSPNAANCILYEETHTLNMTGTSGIFHLTLGTGTRGGDDPGLNFKDIFSNAMNFSGLNCDSGTTYNPATGHVRKLKLTFNDGGGAIAVNPDMDIQSVPYAFYAEKLQGKGANDLLQVNSSGANNLTQSNLQSAFTNTNYPKLMDLINGVSNQYISSSPTSSVGFNSQRLTGIADPTGAQDAATKNYTDMHLGGKNLDDSDIGSGVGDGKVLTWDAAGQKWVAEDPVTGMDNLGNHTATMNLDMDGSRVTNMNDPSSAQDAATKNYVDTKLITRNLPATPAAGQDGQALRYDHGSGAWVYYTPIMAGADNLGDHTATQNIELGPNYLTSDGTNKGIFIDADGKVGVGDAHNNPVAVLDVKGNIKIANSSTTCNATHEGEIRYDIAAHALYFCSDTGWKEVGDAAAAGVVSIFGRGGTVTAQAGDYTASQVTNVAAGNIAATNVQTAINELDTEKVAKAGDTMTGALAMSTNKITGLGDPTAAQDAATKSYVDGRILGNVLSAPGAGQTGQAVRWDGSAWEYYTPTTGNVSDSRDMIAGAGLTGGGTLAADRTFNVGAGTGIIVNANDVAVDVGTTANKIVQLDASGRLPAVDGSQLTNLPVGAGDIESVNTAANSGLTGGATSGSVNLSVDINGTAAETTADNADKILIYDNSASALRSMTRSNFLAGVASITDLTAKANEADVLKKDGSVALTANWDVGNRNINNVSGMSIGAASPNASAALDISSTTKGFLPPRMTTAQRTGIASPAEGLVVHDTTEKALYVHANGGWVKLGAAANEFLVHRSGVNQSIPATTWTDVVFTTKSFDTGNSFDTGTNRFQPTQAGYYFLQAGVFYSTFPSPNTAYICIAKNGAYLACNLRSVLTSSETIPLQTQALVYLNGSTDYVHVQTYQSTAGAFSISGSGTYTFLSGFAVNAGHFSGGGGSDNLGSHIATQNIALVNNWISNDGDSEGIRIDASGNVGIGAASPVAILDVNGNIKIANSSTTCNTTHEGEIRYDSTAKKIYFCNESSWVEVGDAAAAGVATIFGRSGAVTAQAGDYTATQITNTPAGNIAAANVQAAINELDTEKVGTGRSINTGDGLTGGGNLSADRTIAVNLATDPGLEFSTGALRVKAGAGLTRDANGVSHADTSSQASVDNSNGTVIQDITLDTYGHLTGLVSTNLDSRYHTQAAADSAYVNVSGDTMTGALNLPSNGLAVGTDQLVVSGGNVGIGTTNPSVSLDVGSKTDSIRVPAGTTAQRPGSPANGYIRYNTDSNKFEAYENGAWKNVIGGGGGANGWTFVDKTANFTVLTSENLHFFRMDTAAPSYVVARLPLASSAGDNFEVKFLVTGTGKGYVFTSNGETINGDGRWGVELASDQIVTLISDGDNWFTSDRYGGSMLDSSLSNGYFVIDGLSATNGALGGLSGANNRCLNRLRETEWKGKAAAEYKELLVAGNVFAFLCDSTTCQNLQPSTTYQFASNYWPTRGGDTFTTDTSGLGPNDSNNWTHTNRLCSGNDTYGGCTNHNIWTGRAAGVNTLWPDLPHSHTCSDWSNGTNSFDGRRGNTGNTGNSRWSTGANGCSNNYYLVCFVNP